MRRVAVFIDWQNAYQQARVAFGLAGPGSEGQFSPLRLAQLLAERNRRGEDVTFPRAAENAHWRSTATPTRPGGTAPYRGGCFASHMDDIVSNWYGCCSTVYGFVSDARQWCVECAGRYYSAVDRA